MIRVHEPGSFGDAIHFATADGFTVNVDDYLHVTAPQGDGDREIVAIFRPDAWGWVEDGKFDGPEGED